MSGCRWVIDLVAPLMLFPELIGLQMVRTAKEAFTRIGNPGAIIAGTVGAQSTREAIELCRDAASAGADYTLILPPSYYPGAMKPDAIQSFFEDVSLTQTPTGSKLISSFAQVANASPIPVLIYSYPAVCSGINMDTDLIGRLARHPNIAGVKHTDHDIGKIAREAAMADIGCTFLYLWTRTHLTWVSQPRLWFWAAQQITSSVVWQ